MAASAKQLMVLAGGVDNPATAGANYGRGKV
jgi:hypothetical protein